MKIAVIGDIIVDKYFACEIKTNPENVAPCYKVVDVKYVLGGAANVARCLQVLGSTIDFYSAANFEYSEHQLAKTLKSMHLHKYISPRENKTPCVKERVIVDDVYMCRIDKDNTEPLDNDTVDSIIEKIKSQKYEYIVVSDYNKGIITKYFADELKKLKSKLIVDTKPVHAEWFKGAYLLKPNQKEWEEMHAHAIDYEHVLITRGAYGMELHTGCVGVRIPAVPVNVVDVTGAGDTVLATVAHFLNKGKPLIEACELANKAAAIKVQHMGCYQVTEDDILKD